MTIILELPPETQAALIAQAKARGLSLDAFLQTIITTQAAAMVLVEPVELFPREGEDCGRAIDELFDDVQLPPGVGDGAMRRENCYR